MRIVALLLGIVASACAQRGPQNREFDGELAYQYVLTQTGFGPRVPGTAGHRAAADWIEARLHLAADSVEVDRFLHVTAEGDSLPLRNLIARFRPEDPNRILFLAHWDTRPLADASLNIGQQMRPVPGANDGASGVAILLGVADALRANPPTVGVDLLFVDGEDYGDFSGGAEAEAEAEAGADVLIGSRHFAANLPPDYEPLFGVLFDLVGDSDLQIYQEGYSINGAPEVVARVWRAAADAGYRRIFISSVRHTIIDDHVPLLEAGLRVVNVIDFDYPFWHTTEDTIDKVSQESLQIVGDVAMLLIRQ